MGKCQQGVCVSVDDAFHSVIPETVEELSKCLKKWERK